MIGCMSDGAVNPLREIHEQAEAEFQAYADVEIVATFGEPQAEYAAIRKGCALIDLPQRGILEVRGPDRIEFLNRFLTNELINKETKTPIAPGRGVYAFLLNNKGRIVTDMNVLERGDRILLETDARNIANLKGALEKYIFSEKVEFSTLATHTHQIALHGPKSGDVLRQLTGGFTELSPISSATAKIVDIETIIWRDDPCGVPGYFLILPTEMAPRIWMSILTAFPESDPGKRAIRPAGWAVFNTTRIEAGRGLFGIDFDDSVLPAETGQLERAVSFTKGCYLGQEIVARMHARSQIARQVVGMRMNDQALPMAGAPIVDAAQNQVGIVTSSTISPVLSNAAICLGMVKKQFCTVGSTIKIAAEGVMRDAAVVELPFVRPS
jgi:folate-binding protein YgfZ